MNKVATWSPTATRLTFAPTLTTTPAPSCPPTSGERDGDVTGLEVVVGVAQTACHHLDLDLEVLGIVELELLDRPLATYLKENRPLRLH